MFEEPIRTIEQAKEIFRAMGCTHFHMMRDYPQRYEEYKRLKISERVETQWREERVNEYYTQIMENQDSSLFRTLHSSMENLVRTLKTDRALQMMLEVTQYIRDKVPFEDRVIVSETINGRSSRSGLIYLAYDMGNLATARAFVELSLHFATYVEQKTSKRERCQRATELCHAIKRELGL